MADERRIAVLVEDEASVAGAIAVALRRGLSPGPGEDAPERDAGPIALPAADDDAPPIPLRVERADVAIALDPESLELARRASVPKVVALWPHLAPWDAEIEADLVLVAHSALVREAVRRGVPSKRVVVVGPVAPDGWRAPEDRAAARADAGLEGDRPVVVVRASALAEMDLAPALVQLSLVSHDARWLFDVGADAELARSLRRHVPGYGLDALMFADGPEAPASYARADLVLGRFDGPEASRAFAVGAGLVGVPPSRDRLRLAHAIETAGVARLADAAPTLAVTLDAALAPSALEAARQASEALDAANGVARVVAEVRALMRGERGGAALAAGLPAGLERLSEADRSARGRRPDPAEPGPDPEPTAPPARDDLDAKVDAELAALREKLGL